jgi:CrcB protein
MGLVGTLAISVGRLAHPENLRLFLMVGICGGFTTLSSFSLDTFSMVRTGDWFRAAANITLSVGVCIFALALGHAIAGHALVTQPPVVKFTG